MAFDKFKNFWNVDIKNGVKGKGVVQSASMPTESATATNVSMCLDVYVEGWEPFRVQHHCVVKMSKHPSPGRHAALWWSTARTRSGSTSSGRK